MPTAEKAETIEELRTRIAGATTAVLTEYRGLTVHQLSELRKQLRAASAEYGSSRTAWRGSPWRGLPWPACARTWRARRAW